MFLRERQEAAYASRPIGTRLPLLLRTGCAAQQVADFVRWEADEAILSADLGNSRVGSAVLINEEGGRHTARLVSYTPIGASPRP